MKIQPLILAAAFAASACSPDGAQHNAEPETAGTSPAAPAALPSAVAADTSEAAPSATPTSDANTLRLAGLGALRIGQPVAADSGWAERGAQSSDGCRTVTSPGYPGVYGIVENGIVRRVSAGERSAVRLVEGIGAGSTEAAVRRAFPGFREEPHKYVASPAKYLTAPRAEQGGPAVRFEIGQDRKVSIVHVGTMPVLGYVEGCS